MLVIYATAGLITLVSVIVKILVDQDHKHKLELMEAKKQSQLALEGQRYEKIKEIMTDGLISDQPAALEALKPLVELIAEQIRGDSGLKLKELEHKHKLELVEAQNGPLKSWMRELTSMRIDLNNKLMTIDEFERAVDKFSESTEKVFGVSIQKALPVAEESRALPESTNSQ